MSYYLNNPSYYRSHQYAHQFNLPDSAFVNRKRPDYTSQMPQGVSHFMPSNKKHFQRLGYQSTITEEHLINHQSPQETSSPAKNKDYYRNLSIEDIQGASTNTLISQALKNRIKAKEHYLKKQKQRSIEENAYHPTYISENALFQKQAERLLKRHKNEVNYHQKHKIRTEPSQQQLSRSNDRKENQVVNRYKQQLQMAQKQIQQLQQRIEFSKKKRIYSEASQNNRPLIMKKDANEGIINVRNQTDQLRLPKINENQYKSLKNQFPIIPTQSAAKQYQKQDRKRSFTQPSQKAFSYENAKNLQIYPNKDQVVEREPQNQPYKSDQKLHQSRIRRQEIRKMNPTYLSYGTFTDPNNVKMVYL